MRASMWWRRAAAWVKRDRLDDELRAEIDDHLEHRRQQLMAPVLGEGVVMFPNSAIIGGCRIGDRTVLSQGTSLIDTDSPGDCVVYRNGRDVTFAKTKRNILADYFRI